MKKLICFIVIFVITFCQLTCLANEDAIIIKSYEPREFLDDLIQSMPEKDGVFESLIRVAYLASLFDPDELKDDDNMVLDYCTFIALLEHLGITPLEINEGICYNFRDSKQVIMYSITIEGGLEIEAYMDDNQNEECDTIEKIYVVFDYEHGGFKFCIYYDNY